VSLCNKTWLEQYVTGERNVSIKRLHHRCDQQAGHGGDGSKKPTPCTSYTNPRPGFGVTRVTRTYSGLAWSTRYYVRVVAVDQGGNLSACSDEASTVTNAPSAPTGATVTPVN